MKGGGRDFHRYKFRGRDVVSWLDGLLKSAEHVGLVPEGAVRLSDCAASYGIPTLEMISRLRQGVLKIVSGVGSGRTFAGTFVVGPPDGETADEVVAAKVAISTLGLSGANVQVLADAWLLERREG